MKSPKCKLFEQATRYRQKAVRSLRFDGDTLVVEIQGEGFAFARVIFEEVVGFRVLDERDLCEFWNKYHEGTGWLYEVEEGGWLELEKARHRFNSDSVIPDLREYFIVDDKCISVLTNRPPQILDFGTDPSR
jgi:hypothetical protein